MKIRVASDLHFEFHADGGLCLAQELAQGDFDVLVVAGDLSSFSGLHSAIKLLCEVMAPKRVVYVMGNHEAYGATLDEAMNVVRRVKMVVNNLTFLERTFEIIQGQRFIGCTLWFPHSGKIEPHDHNMADFSMIRDIRRWLPETAAKSAGYLACSVQPGDIVVTHHLPHPRSIAPRFVGSPLNAYFLYDLAKTVEDGHAAIWVHGHTHNSCDYLAGSTRVLCNPLGYARFAPGEHNPHFRSDFDIVI